jgi:catechol 2,3-dioxygenase-like lactoylglutathione lyase family enzyme
MTRPTIESISPFFIVSHIQTIVAFYRDKLGFELKLAEPEVDPFFVVIARDGAWLNLKAGDAKPLPNPKRDPAMRWDAFCETFEPDALAAEFTERGVAFSNPLKDTCEGLRGFEITDPDGYVLFFGCPRHLAETHSQDPHPTPLLDG